MAITDLVDIVDQDDTIIGTKTIQEDRANGDIHRIARVMVEHPDGKLLLQKRTAKLLWPNCWDNSAAGHVDAGEDYLTAAQRELFEEIGLKNVELEEVGTYFTDVHIHKDHLRRFNRLYKVKYRQTPTKLEASEVAEVRWFTIAEVKDLVDNHPDKVTDGLTDVINKYY